ncbi:MAG: YeeE/YedE family protein [Deltaproteobacteria bacterium]|nr:YeeE/YedE family protein [Deltaproteobacteria bacterium]MDZ4343779.1 YeeE/YedE family protein [Candidatus Binatia bacterium]
MAAIVSALLIGALFGFGLAVSEMIDPARVIGFLDVAGRWDPTLLFVMGGALAVTLPGFPLILRRARPLLAEFFAMPTQSRLDGSLITGATIFGIGWGIAGFCPGPALAALASGSPGVAVFVVAMIAGQWAGSLLEQRP